MIGFIGLGNMAKAMIGGILNKKLVLPNEIIGSAKTKETLKYCEETYGIQVCEDNAAAAAQSDILFLAVKPAVLSAAAAQIKDAIKEDTVVVSIAAGKTLADLEKMFEKPVKLVRCMPNTPALVSAGCTAITGGERVSGEELDRVKQLLSSFGTVQEVAEGLMDAVVGVSGSSPAYVFLFIEALADGAVKAGMPRKQAYEMAAQSVLGSAKLLLETGKHPGELKDMVCSPGGTTIEAVQVLEEMGFRSAVMAAVEACVEKSRNL